MSGIVASKQRLTATERKTPDFAMEAKSTRPSGLNEFEGGATDQPRWPLGDPRIKGRVVHHEVSERGA